MSPNFIFLWCRQPLAPALCRHTVLELLSKSQGCPQPPGMEFSSSLPLLALLACALLLPGAQFGSPEGAADIALVQCEGGKGCLTAVMDPDDQHVVSWGCPCSWGLCWGTARGFMQALLVRVRQLQCTSSLCCRRGPGPQELGIPVWNNPFWIQLLGLSCG